MYLLIYHFELKLSSNAVQIILAIYTYEYTVEQ